MSYQLIPPGARKNNPFWVVRYRDPFTSKSTEYSTKKSDKKAAERVAVNFWHRLLQAGPPQRRAGTEVRILLPRARSLLRTSLSGRIPSKNRRSESSPLEAIAPEDAAVAPG